MGPENLIGGWMEDGRVGGREGRKERRREGRQGEMGTGMNVRVKWTDVMSWYEKGRSIIAV